jgi:hypothetical protein
MNVPEEKAVRWLTLTVIPPSLNPEGTVTVKDDEVEEVTTAFDPPNSTRFSAGIGLNPLPEIVTGVPTAPDDGENPVITGCALPEKAQTKAKTNRQNSRAVSFKVQ